MGLSRHPAPSSRREALPHSAGDARDPTLPPIARSGTPSSTRLRAASGNARNGWPSGGASAATRGKGSRAAASLVRWLGRLTVLASVAGGLYALGYGGWRFLTSSPRFNVAEVDLVDFPGRDGSLRHADPDELIRRTGVLGRNIFAVDTDAVRRELEADPWIRTAEVTRDLPARLEVKLREERPLVLVAMGTLYLADEQGRLFKRLGPGDPADFPVITGIDRVEYETTPVVATTRIREGIAAVRAFDRSAVAKRARLEEVVVDGALGTTVVLLVEPPASATPGAAAGATDGPPRPDPAAAARAVSVRFGRGAHPEKLARLARVLDALGARDLAPGLILLDDAYQPDRVVVRTSERPPRLHEGDS